MSVAGAPYNRQAVEFEEESTFGADAAFSSPTRMIPTAVVDISGLTQGKETREGVYQRPGDGETDIKGIIGGSFTVEMYLTGHGSTSVGALTATVPYTLLKAALGGGDAANTGDAASGVPTATSVPTTSGVFADSSLCRVGTLGDGGGGGQFAGVASEAANTLTLATALPAAPSSGHDVSACLQVYNPSDPCLEVTSHRWRIFGANAQVEAFGCFATGVSISGINPGQQPKVAITYQVAWWRRIDSAITFPSTNTTDMKESAAVSGGSFALQNFGTSARTAYNLRQVSLDIDLNTVVKTGLGGVHTEQIVLGAFYNGANLTLNATFDAPVAGTETYEDLWLDTDQFYQAVLTLSTQDGKGVGLWLQKCKITGARPAQSEFEERNAVSLTLQSVLVDDSSATALERAGWILGMC